MRLIIISIIGALVHFSQATDLNRHPHTERTRSTHHKKRGIYVGDLSFSYAATDVGSVNGSHVKTITVIKNLALPKQEKNHYQSDNRGDDWIKNQFKHDIPTLPEFPEFPPFGFDEEKKPQEQPPQTESVAPEPQADTELTSTDQAKGETEKKQPEPAEVTKVKVDAAEKDVETSKVEETPKEASDDAEYIQPTDETAKLKSQKYTQMAANLHRPINEDEFSDYAMHNVRHINDPIPKKKVNSRYENSGYKNAPRNTKISSYKSNSQREREEFNEDAVELVPLNEPNPRNGPNKKPNHQRHHQSEQEYRGRYESPSDDSRDLSRNPKHEEYEPNEGFHSTHESISSSEQEYNNKYGDHSEFSAKYQVQESPKSNQNNNPYNTISSTTQQPYKAPKQSQPLKPFIPSQSLPSNSLETLSRAAPISSTTQKPYLAPNVKSTYQVQTRFEYVKPTGTKVKPTKSSQRSYLAPNLNFQPRPTTGTSTSTTQKPNVYRQTQYLAPGSQKIPKQIRAQKPSPSFAYEGQSVVNTAFINTQRSPVQFPSS